MNRDIFIKNLTGDKIEMSPKGRCANELSVEEFEKGYEKFFEMIFGIADTDISSLTGYGEFDEDNKAPFATFEEFVRETFNEDQEGYWHNWKQMFETTFLKKDYFDKIYAKIMQYAPYCEGQRFLANNNTFFVNIIVDDAGKAYCADWGRAGIVELAEDFYLSPESIKKIVYGKKIKLPVYSPSIYSAKQYSDAGVGEEWVRIYLENGGLETPDGEEFFLSELVKIPLRLIEDDADVIINKKSDGYTDVPLIALFEGHRFRSFCGEEYLALLRKEKKNAHWAFIFVSHKEYSYYLNNFGKQFQRGT